MEGEPEPEGTKLCRACEQAIPEEARECPHCGAEQPPVNHGPIEEGILKTGHD